MVEMFFYSNRSGSSYGLRDSTLLASAVGRPQQTFDGQDLYPDLAAKAAALTQSLILNHPFLDANKRTGILSGCIFMTYHGHDIVVDETSLYATAVAVEDKSMGFDDLHDWFGDTNTVLPLMEDELEAIQRGDWGMEWLW